MLQSDGTHLRHSHHVLLKATRRFPDPLLKFVDIQDVG